MFAATAATIVSGAVAERCEFVGYLVYSALISGFLYPIVTHWAWAPNGWLALGASITFSDDGVPIQLKYHDFAGSGVVHLLGGTAALVAAIILRPRLGRFDPTTGLPREIRGHSVPLVSLGGFILFFGFLAFNGGSQAAIASEGDGQAVALSMVNTCLSGSSAAFLTMAIQKLRFGTWSLLSTINGGLAGMVAICAGCNAVQPWSALVIGLVASLAYLTVSWLVLKLGCDDPLEAVGVHAGGGFVGVILVAFFRNGDGILVSPGRRSGMNLLWQLVGAAAILLWSAVLSVLIFGSLRLLRLFRVSEEHESKGLDIPKHGEPAYPLAAYGHGWE
uniref:Ammonium_transp domain-containing protein n=1 Tax=Macrostomum lignano TaxID=282301 RepID=A0A1I8J5V5_9PLAT